MNRKHQTIQEFLEKNSLTEVAIKTHAHGVRLEIHERWRTVVSVVEANIDLAWTEALKALPKGRANRAQQEIDKYQGWIKDKQEDIDSYKEEITKLRKQLPRRKKSNT